jgi:pullulanase/glycogen debranching enzyme
VTAVEVRDVVLPDSMKRAMAGARPSRIGSAAAKIINAEGEFQAAEKLVQAASMIQRSRSPCRFFEKFVGRPSIATNETGLWHLIPKPPLASPIDTAIYELQIRDFSISDPTVPKKDRGKYTTSTHFFSRGMLHLWSPADAGLRHVHLLPSFDFTSVPELASGFPSARLPQKV